ncbi:hypothetical protein OSB04_016060 [Centaurea solstitialis]|uniref:Reverse transcriptase Ty1/copia-type domain-containing protein n=1 Tax=Centaurea solstitialis TaxID=347529 RepID=A0AA38T076_9ASTR|nr:hypothetical protein OSB04_016060 [Centaurea solstitialis]
MCDSIKKLEQFRRESNEVIGSLEDQIKAYQANELQFEYDQNYWKWERKEYEIKLSKCRSELEKVKVELEQSKFDLEKFSKASKAMDEILKAQINDDLKRGIGYHNTPPPYNNNYIPPKSNLADRLDTEDLKHGVTEVDPVEGVVEDLGGEEDTRKKEKDLFVKSNKIEKEKGKGKIDTQSSESDPSSSKQFQYKRGNQRNWNNQWAKSHGIDLSKINRPKPCFICCKLNHLARNYYFNPINQRNSFQNLNTPWIERKKQQPQAKKVEPSNKRVVPNQNRQPEPTGKGKEKKAEPKSVKMVTKWVPKVAVQNITATEDISNNCESKKKNIVASNSNNTPPVTTVVGPEKRKPYIVTKYSIHEIPNKEYLLKLNRLVEFKQWLLRHMTGIMSLLENFKRFEGGHVAFGDNPKGGKTEPKKVFDALKDPSWIEAMQEELLQFVLQHVWDLVDLPRGHRAIGTKWIFRNKKDERGIVIKNKFRLVAQGYTQEEGIDYDDVFAPVARIEAIRLFLAFASFKRFKVYQMDVKSAFLYGKIEEEVYVCQPPGFEDPKFPDKVYKLRKALYGLHQAPRAWYDTLSTYLLENQFDRGVIDKTLFIKKKESDLLLVQIYVDDIIFGSTKEEMCKEFEDLMHKRFKMSSMGELTFFLGLQVKQKEDGILINQSKYVKDMLTKFGFMDAKSASTPMETHKQLTVDVEGEEVDVHQYRYMIGSLMYLTPSRPDIMFAVCVCARFQVRPKDSHLQAVKRIFRYLKGQPRLGLWYPYESPFELLAYTDSDYGGASLDRKSTSGGCQFLAARLVSWQCKKQTTVSTSTVEAEYVAAAQCCSQVLWIQNQMLDYGITFLNTPVYIDNNSAISIVNNPVKHSKTKHIEIKYHFIRDSNEKKLIQVLKVHTDYQYADLFTKAFDVGRFKFLITSCQSDIIAAGIGYCCISGVIAAESANRTLLLQDLVIAANWSLLLLREEHNKVGFLSKGKKSESFNEIVDFLQASTLAHAILLSPKIYIDHQRDFWRNARVETLNNQKVIQTTVSDRPLSVSETTIQRCLHLDDEGGETSIPTTDIFPALAQMGYEGSLKSLKIQKNKFGHQWKFLVHILIHCFSRKTSGWSEFGSTIASA